MIDLFSLWRPIHSWIVTHLVAPRPWIMSWLPRWYRNWYFDRAILPRLMAAQAAGTGIFMAWVEPGTSSAEVGGWLDACITTAKATQDDYGMIRVIIAHCTEKEWQTGGTYPDDRLVLKWEGMADAWWAIGHPLAMRATSVEHNGLHIGLNITGMWFSAAMGITRTSATSSTMHHLARDDEDP